MIVDDSSVLLLHWHMPTRMRVFAFLCARICQVVHTPAVCTGFESEESGTISSCILMFNDDG